MTAPIDKMFNIEKCVDILNSTIRIYSTPYEYFEMKRRLSRHLAVGQNLLPGLT